LHLSSTPHSCEQQTDLCSRDGRPRERAVRQASRVLWSTDTLLLIMYTAPWYIPRVARRRVRRVPSPWMTRREDLVFWRARPGVSFQSGGAAQHSAKPPANLSLLSLFIVNCYHFRHYSSASVIIVVGLPPSSNHAVDYYPVLTCPAITPSNIPCIRLSGV
jgi:hypothetical protein